LRIRREILHVAGFRIWQRQLNKSAAVANRVIRAIESRMESEGIDLVVRPSISVKRLAWCTGIDFCIPVDVRTDAEVRMLAGLAKQLLKGETTLSREFPAYEYGRAGWLAEAEMRKQDRQQSADESAP